MSLARNVMVSAGVTFGLTFLLTVGGPAGAAAAMFTGLMWAGLVGAVTMAFSSDYRSSWPSIHYPHYSSFSPSSDRSFFAWTRMPRMGWGSTAHQRSYHGSTLRSPAAASHVPPTAHHTGTTFIPAATPAAPPASIGANAHLVSSEFIPAGAPARTFTHAAPTHSSSTPPTGSTRHVASTFRPANVAPSHSPAPGAKHISSSFRPA